MMRGITDRPQRLSRLNGSRLENRGGKEKLKYAEKKLLPSKEPAKDSETRMNFSEITSHIRQGVGLYVGNDLETVSNCRIVSDEYVREMMKKYGKEIRRV